MAFPIREKILQAIETRLKTITVANGFNFDVGTKVNRCIKSLDHSDAPYIVFWDLRETNDGKYGINDLSMTVKIEMIIKYSENVGASTKNNYALADVLTAMGSSDPTGGYSNGVVFTGATPIYPDNGRQICGVSVDYDVKYSTLDPYTQA